MTLKSRKRGFADYAIPVNATPTATSRNAGRTLNSEVRLGYGTRSIRVGSSLRTLPTAFRPDEGRGARNGLTCGHHRGEQLGVARGCGVQPASREGLRDHCGDSIVDLGELAVGGVDGVWGLRAVRMLLTFVVANRGDQRLVGLHHPAERGQLLQGLQPCVSDDAADWIEAIANGESPEAPDSAI